MKTITSCLAVAVCLAGFGPALGCGPRSSDSGAESGDSGGGDDDKGGDDKDDWGAEDRGAAEDSGGDDRDDKPDDDGGDPDDPNSGVAVRECLECWAEQSAECQPLLDACKADLACGQLIDCPFACGGTLECVQECNEIIPSGVEALTEVMECLVCNNDAPCVADCQNDVMLSYCG